MKLHCSLGLALGLYRTAEVEGEEGPPARGGRHQCETTREELEF